MRQLLVNINKIVAVMALFQIKNWQPDLSVAASTIYIMFIEIEVPV